MTDPNRAVVSHLISLIQSSADIRYYVGGAGSRMRELLVEAIRANWPDEDPLALLEPASHRADEEPRVKRMERECDRMENGIEAIRRALEVGNGDRAERLVADLQAGKEVLA